MLLLLLESTAAILAVWLVIGLVLLGIGLLMRRLFGLRGITIDCIHQSCWIGFAMSIAILQVWNLLGAITWATGAILLALGLFGLALGGREALRRLGRAINAHRWTTVVLILAAWWIADRAIGPADFSDSGLYHLTAIRWATKFAAVPGLANIDVHLGFNNPSLLWAAVLEFGWWRGSGAHLANGVLLAMFLMQAIIGGSRLWRGSRRPVDLFDFVLLIPAILLAVSKQVPSPATDLPVTLVEFVAASWLLRLLIDRDADEPQFAYMAAAVCLLAVTAFCLKLSSAVFAVLAVAVALGAFLRALPKPAIASRTIAWVVCLVLLLMVPWTIRGMILSGYPLFPSTVLASQADWSVPPDQAPQEQGIEEFARADRAKWLIDTLAGHPSLGRLGVLSGWAEARGWRWVVPWTFAAAVGSPVEIVLPLAIFLWAIIAWQRSRRRGSTEKKCAIVAWLLLPSLLAAVFWFLEAPEPRFGLAALWIAAATALAMAYQNNSTTFTGRHVVAIVALLSLAPIAHRMAIVKVAFHQNPLTKLPLEWPGPDHGLHAAPVPVGGFRRLVPHWGLTIYVPVKTNELPYDGPLPCAFAGDNNLARLAHIFPRKPGDLAAGFRYVSKMPTR